jgi:hypothetical protein
VTLPDSTTAEGTVVRSYTGTMKVVLPDGSARFVDPATMTVLDPAVPTTVRRTAPTGPAGASAQHDEAAEYRVIRQGKHRGKVGELIARRKGQVTLRFPGDAQLHDFAKDAVQQVTTPTSRDITTAFPHLRARGITDPRAQVNPVNAVQIFREIVDQFHGDYRELAIALSHQLHGIELSNGPTSYYDHNYRTIVISRNGRNLGSITDPTNTELVWIASHELGHSLDHALARLRMAWTRPDQRVSEELIDAIRADAAELARPETKKAVLQELAENINLSDSPGTSDTIAAITQNNIRGRYKHKKGYWANPGAREKEVFANLFSLFARNQREQIAFLCRYCPKTMAQFMEIMRQAFHMLQ